MRKHKVGITATIVAVLTGSAILAVGCSHQLDDQGDVAQANADYEITYLNVDGFPNITVVCIMGVGFVTISRNYNSLTPEPKWDSFCATQIPSGGPHVIPGTGTVHPVTRR